MGFSVTVSGYGLCIWLVVVRLRIQRIQEYINYKYHAQVSWSNKKDGEKNNWTDHKG